MPPNRLPAAIGLISDTHGLLRPEAQSALEGSELIVHAGDVGTPEILEQLQRIAPVVAVRGNIDRGSWASALPRSAVAQTAGGSIYVLHDLHQLDLDPAVAGFTIVVSGHSHKPDKHERAGALYLNPGSAGPRRFRLPITVARLDVSRRPFHFEFVDLAKGG
ncbi:MAG TPA: metallophosphoesterase family protein [Bryobacteraceae bacterium]|nr:metallophosphoesterase family protein [Bryobacteraceae bacterium]